MTKRLFLLLFACLGFHVCFATLGVLATKPGANKAYMLDKGAVVKLQYTGYQGQVQEFKGRIIYVDSQFLELENMALRNKQSFRIAISDILGFRPYSTLRQIGKSALELGLVGGNLVLYSTVVAPLALAPVAAAGISIGVALVSYGVVKLVFPDKIKYTKQDGWSFRVVEIAYSKG